MDQTCGLYPLETPAVPVPVDINAMQWTAWDCCNGADFNPVKDDQGSDNVVEFQFGAPPTASGVTAPRPLDMRIFSGGTVEFEFQQISPPPEGSVWYVKLVAEITAAQVLLTDGGAAPNDTWQHYAFPLKREMAGADMSNIKHLLIFPSWGKAEGAAMRIKNIKFSEP